MCKHPLKGFTIGTTASGKAELKITSYNCDHVEKVNNVWIPAESKFVSNYASQVSRDWQEIPCGHCIDCRLQHSRMWANRCMMELNYYDPCECWFLTLTYDEEHVPKVQSDIFQGTLVKEDLQKFWKRLRRDADYHGDPARVRYFACGEYGIRGRPHYHAILYGYPLVDLVTWTQSKSGYIIYRSNKLEKIWGKGIVALSPVTWDTCAYTARYVLKKSNKIDKIYKIENVCPEFITMSRNPGIGRDYYEEFKDKVYKFDEIILKTQEGGIKVKPPRYFDNLYECKDPDDLKNIKEERKKKRDSLSLLKMSQTDLDYLDMLRAEEETLMSRIKSLRRDKI